MMKNLEVLEEIRKQGKNLIETKRDEFVKQNLLSDEFIQMMQKNKKPFELRIISAPLWKSRQSSEC